MKKQVKRKTPPQTVGRFFEYLGACSVPVKFKKAMSPERAWEIATPHQRQWVAGAVQYTRFGPVFGSVDHDIVQRYQSNGGDATMAKRVVFATFRKWQRARR